MSERRQAGRADERDAVSRPLADVRLEGLRTTEGPPPHLQDVSLHVRYGEFFTVLGPPHSGKTALLRAVAGFLPLAAGRVLVDGRDVGALPPAARSMGIVFQEGALWPHLTVREHVAFGLKRHGMTAAEIERRLAQVLRRLGLTDVESARPAALTLEQGRRLALARALATEPRVLLLDEPLAHLDPVTRKSLRLELAHLHRDLAVTTIHVTRDAADALALSDRIAVIRDGVILQLGDVEQLYQRPASRAVAEALGPATFLPVRVVEVRDLGVVVETDAGAQVPVAGIGNFHAGDRGLLVMRPETLALTEATMGRGPGIPGRVTMRVFEGARYLYEVDIDVGVPVRVEVTAPSQTRIFRLGDPVRVECTSETVVLIPAD
jgi:ABC-type Fe3+/spermidine/putrescine transport system ATPase subunit